LLGHYTGFLKELGLSVDTPSGRLKVFMAARIETKIFSFTLMSLLIGITCGLCPRFSGDVGIGCEAGLIKLVKRSL
jgi:hypothetical protein